jgi:hypothetical protein
MRLPLLAVAAVSALAGAMLVRADAQEKEAPAALKPGAERIYVSDLPQAERDATNENFSPGLVVGPRRPDNSRRIQWRHKLVGDRVTVEGIALGEAPQQPSHMTTQRVAYEGAASSSAGWILPARVPQASWSG